MIDARHVANTFGKSCEFWSDLILFAAYYSPSRSLLLQSIGQRMSPRRCWWDALMFSRIINCRNYATAALPVVRLFPQSRSALMRAVL